MGGFLTLIRWQILMTQISWLIIYPDLQYYEKGSKIAIAPILPDGNTSIPCQMIGFKYGTIYTRGQKIQFNTLYLCLWPLQRN